MVRKHTFNYFNLLKFVFMAQSRVYLNILSELERKCILLISAAFCWLSQISLLYCSSLLLVYLCWFSVLLSTQRGMLKSPIIIMDVCFFCSFCQFCFIYFESLQLGAYKLRIFMSSWYIPHISGNLDLEFYFVWC